MNNEPLIIPGADLDGGDDLLDVVAAAQLLGIAVSTLRSHQYQDSKRPHPSSPALPQPEDPQDVEIALPAGAGIEWARAIDQLLLRSGGRGLPVRLWRRSKLRDYRDAKAALEFAEEAIGAQLTEAQQRFVEASMEGAEVAAAEGRANQGRIQVMLPGEGKVDLEPLASDEAQISGILYGESFTDDSGNQYRRAGIAIDVGKSAAALIETEAFAAENPDAEITAGEPSKKLTAKEVLERARLRREGKL